jgi:hypothetical protein
MVYFLLLMGFAVRLQEKRKGAQKERLLVKNFAYFLRPQMRIGMMI